MRVSGRLVREEAGAGCTTVMGQCTRESGCGTRGGAKDSSDWVSQTTVANPDISGAEEVSMLVRCKSGN